MLSYRTDCILHSFSFFFLFLIFAGYIVIIHFIFVFILMGLFYIFLLFNSNINETYSGTYLSYLSTTIKNQMANLSSTKML